MLGFSAQVNGEIIIVRALIATLVWISFITLCLGLGKTMAIGQIDVVVIGRVALP